MNNKETNSFKEPGNQNYQAKKMRRAENSKKNKDLPWWVEFLFVQIGLPDKLLIKILKTKKKAKELIKNEKKLFINYHLNTMIVTLSLIKFKFYSYD